MIRTHGDMEESTEHGACAVAILVTKKLTGFEVIERSVRALGSITGLVRTRVFHSDLRLGSKYPVSFAEHWATSSREQGQVPSDRAIRRYGPRRPGDRCGVQSTSCQSGQAMSDTGALHRAAMEKADEAMVARREGRLEEANRLFREALRLESEAAMTLMESPEEEPTRSVLFRSAASLAINGEMPAYAAYLIACGLDGNPPPEIREELRELLRTVRPGITRSGGASDTEGQDADRFRRLVSWSDVWSAIDGVAENTFRNTALRRPTEPFPPSGNPREYSRCAAAVHRRRSIVTVPVRHRSWRERHVGLACTTTNYLGRR